MIKRASLFVIFIVVSLFYYMVYKLTYRQFIELIYFIQVVYGVDQELENEEILAQDYMNELDGQLLHANNIEVTAEWNYASNITDENEKIKTEISAKNAEFYKVKYFLFFLLWEVFLILYIFVIQERVKFISNYKHTRDGFYF